MDGNKGQKREVVLATLEGPARPPPPMQLDPLNNGALLRLGGTCKQEHSHRCARQQLHFNFRFQKMGLNRSTLCMEAAQHWGEAACLPPWRAKQLIIDCNSWRRKRRRAGRESPLPPPALQCPARVEHLHQVLVQQWRSHNCNILGCAFQKKKKNHETIDFEIVSNLIDIFRISGWWSIILLQVQRWSGTTGSQRVHHHMFSCKARYFASYSNFNNIVNCEHSLSF